MVLTRIPVRPGADWQVPVLPVGIEWDVHAVCSRGGALKKISDCPDGTRQGPARVPFVRRWITGGERSLRNLPEPARRFIGQIGEASDCDQDADDTHVRRQIPDALPTKPCRYLLPGCGFIPGRVQCPELARRVEPSTRGLTHGECSSHIRREIVARLIEIDRVEHSDG